MYASAIVVLPLAHPQAVAVLYQRSRLGPGERIVEAAIHPLDVWDIFEPLGGQEDHVGATSLQQRVGRAGSAQDEKLDGIEVHLAGLEPSDDRLHRVARG